MSASPAPLNSTATLPDPMALDARTEQAIDALLAGLRWRASVFHVGQYCGRWRASTEGRAQASFHLVLQGPCWVHRPGQAPLPLRPGDAVFLLRDTPHFLSPQADAAAPGAPQPPAPMAATLDGAATGLACGSFGIEGPMQASIGACLPELLVLGANDPDRPGVAALFELMRQEAAHSPVEGSPLLDRLAGLLFFYVLRAAARSGPATGGALALLRHPALAPVVLALIDAPARPWTVQDMAQRAHLSRAALFRQFAQVGGLSPLQFLLQLRMQLAAQRLARGERIARVCEAVGYESPAAFARAFKRVTGRQPGLWQQEPG